MPHITTNQGVVIDPDQVAKETMDQLADENEEPGGPPNE
jgi:hypothetical protein